MKDIAKRSSCEIQRNLHSDLAMHACHNDLKFEEVYHLLWEIVYESKLGNYSQCDTLIGRMKGISDSATPESRKNTLKTIATFIENKHKIGRYNDIEGIIDKLFSSSNMKK